MALTDEIKQRFPKYKELAELSFARSHDLWERPMYQENATFLRLKQKYGVADPDKRVTTRPQLISLYKRQNYYDAYLCTLVWGNIGTYMKARDSFNHAFSIKKKDCNRIIQEVKAMLCVGNIEEAFDSMCRDGRNCISGLGVSFFTKILYFVGETVESEVKPLIFDSTSLKILTRLYADNGLNRVARQTRSCYLDFNIRMNRIARELELPSAGHLEAFLFNCGKCLNLL